MSFFKKLINSFASANESNLGSESKQELRQEAKPKDNSEKIFDNSVLESQESLPKVPDVAAKAFNDLVIEIHKEFNVKPMDPINRKHPYTILDAVDQKTGKVVLVIATDSDRYKEFIGDKFQNFDVKYISLNELLQVNQKTKGITKAVAKAPQGGLIADYINATDALKDVLIEQFAQYLIDNNIEDYRSLDTEQIIQSIFDLDQDEFDDKLEEIQEFLIQNSSK